MNNRSLHATLFAALLALGLAGCSSSSSSGGGSPGDNDGADSGGGAGQSAAAGTFTATGSLKASATLSNLSTTVATLLSSATPVTAFNVVGANGDGTSDITFTSPASITSYTVTADVYFAGAPAAGMTFTTANSCGASSIDFGTTNQPFLYSYESSMMGANCTDTAPTNEGSWTLKLTSATSVPGGTGNYYDAHGSFTTTMPGQSGGTSTLSLTF